MYFVSPSLLPSLPLPLPPPSPPSLPSFFFFPPPATPEISPRPYTLSLPDALPISVGDFVQIKVNQEGTAFITEIEERRNFIVRKSSNLSKQSHILAANVDQVCLVVTLNYPETSTTFIDRFLAAAEAYRVPVILVFNKIDIYNDDDKRLLNAYIHLYQTIGYTCATISAETGEGIDNLLDLLQGKTTLFSGNSGVGKSTLLNRILPNLRLKTAQISTTHKTGMHTTTYSEMYRLPNGGYLIDTPGIKGFGTFDMEKNEISHYFKEIFAESDNCKFGSSCTHTHEPGCAVREALDEHRISESRYTSYLSMLEDQKEGKYRAAH